MILSDWILFYRRGTSQCPLRHQAETSISEWRTLLELLRLASKSFKTLTTSLNTTKNIPSLSRKQKSSFLSSHLCAPQSLKTEGKAFFQWKLLHPLLMKISEQLKYFIIIEIFHSLHGMPVCQYGILLSLSNDSAVISDS